MVGGGGGSVAGDMVWVLSWFCSACICCVSSVACSLSENMVVGNRNEKSEEVLKSSSAVRACAEGQCRQDNGSVCDPPIYAGFGSQNITVIMSQESHYWNAFFDQNPFSTSSKIWQLWVILYTVGKV